MTKPDPIRITGQLLQDAQLTYTPPPKVTAVLTLDIDMPKGRPVHVVHVLGEDVLAHLNAEAKKPLLKRGRWVAVYAAGATEQSDHGKPHIRLQGVTAVHPLPNPAPEPAATPAQEAL